MKDFWDKKEIEYLKENYYAMKHSELAENLNRSRGSVRAKSSRLKLRVRKQYAVVTKRMKTTVYRKFLAGMEIKQIAKESDTSIDCACTIIASKLAESREQIKLPHLGHKDEPNFKNENEYGTFKYTEVIDYNFIWEDVKKEQ